MDLDLAVPSPRSASMLAAHPCCDRYPRGSPTAESTVPLPDPERERICALLSREAPPHVQDGLWFRSERGPSHGRVRAVRAGHVIAFDPLPRARQDGASPFDAEDAPSRNRGRTPRRSPPPLFQIEIAEQFGAERVEPVPHPGAHALSVHLFLSSELGTIIIRSLISPIMFHRV